MSNTKVKKGIGIIVFAVLLLFALVVATGCSKEELNKPNGVYVDDISQNLTLHWSSVRGATKYEIDFGNEAVKAVESRRASYALDELPAGTYNFRIRAIGNGLRTSDSQWSAPVTYVKAQDAGLRYRATADYAAYEVVGIGSAEGDVVIDDTYRGRPVVRIGDAAFSGSTKLKSLTLGKNVTSIGRRAFANCGALESITINDGVTSIGDYAFQRCIKLGSIEMPDTVTLLGNYCFSSCEKLARVTFSNTLQSIGLYAFSNCQSLQAVALPDSVTEIGEQAFYSCTSLTSLHLGSGLTSLATRIFDSCTSLTGVELPGSVTEIGESAFANCEKLASINLQNITAIGDKAFYEATSLPSSPLGKSLESIGQNAFYNTLPWKAATDLVFFDKWLVGCAVPSFEKTYDITKYALEQSGHADMEGIADYALYAVQNITRVELPDTVRHIGKFAFFGIKTMTRANLGNGVRVIHSYAFDSCELLADLIIGENVTDIQDHAFARCTKLTYRLSDDGDALPLIPASVRHIGAYAFYSTDIWYNSGAVVYVDNWLVGIRYPKIQGISSYGITEGTVGICDYAFVNTSGYEYIQLNAELKYMGKAAFYGATGLKEITFASTVPVSDYAFYNCTALTKVMLSDATPSIGRSAFYNCVALKSVSLPLSVRTVDDFAFYNCVEMTDATLRGVTQIGTSAFYGCEKLKAITLTDRLETMGAHAFNSCKALTSVTIGRNLCVLPEYAFANCTSLEKIDLPATVQEIGDHAFYRCTALQSVTMGNGVEDIKPYAFYGCTQLQSVQLAATVKAIGDYAFKGDVALSCVLIPTDLSGQSLLEEIGRYAFYGCDSLTVYSSIASAADEWDVLWNASYRPVVWGCTVMGGVLIAIPGTDAVENGYMPGGLGAPYRDGYTFAGWSTFPGASVAEIAPEDVFTVPGDQILYAVWVADTNV